MDKTVEPPPDGPGRINGEKNRQYVL